jgi:transcriptional regulator with XRE-family HTH domain
MLAASQCRAARGLLDWTQQELADAARIGVATIRQFEGGATEPRHATLVVLRQALESAGVEFIAENGGGAGARLRKRHREKG